MFYQSPFSLACSRLSVRLAYVSGPSKFPRLSQMDTDRKSQVAFNLINWRDTYTELTNRWNRHKSQRGPQLTASHCLFLTISRTFSCQTASRIICRKIVSTFTGLALTWRDDEQVGVSRLIPIHGFLVFNCLTHYLSPLIPKGNHRNDNDTFFIVENKAKACGTIFPLWSKYGYHLVNA